jgi:hypothetical protein
MFPAAGEADVSLDGLLHETVNLRFGLPSIAFIEAPE